MLEALLEVELESKMVMVSVALWAKVLVEALVLM
eukprot:CAMPEP_0195274626 /NCGR_PEP_ID=MMETSP0706-20130129/17290_1 /TAXON_ID=33640 /ORGANISM="Asterionellopsis glacialis, Strain CCMP134" /LENGTH=33 /DNA_ID= /DNA_START= /DNA_END= /DNA_ORIENTATION=